MKDSNLFSFLLLLRFSFGLACLACLPFSYESISLKIHLRPKQKASVWEQCTEYHEASDEKAEYKSKHVRMNLKNSPFYVQFYSTQPSLNAIIWMPCDDFSCRGKSAICDRIRNDSSLFRRLSPSLNGGGERRNGESLNILNSVNLLHPPTNIEEMFNGLRHLNYNFSSENERRRDNKLNFDDF